MKNLISFGFLVTLILICIGTVRTLHISSSNALARRMYMQGDVSVGTIADLEVMNVKEALRSVRGVACDSTFRFTNTDVMRSPPTVCRYLIANPKGFFENPAAAKFHGVDLSLISKDTLLSDLASILPVIYVADVHPEYGTLGLVLNSMSGKTLMDVHPELRAFRKKILYNGGQEGRGSSFTMVHQKVGFPENRKWKGSPEDPEFRLFFSPEHAMVNELNLTGDAKVTDFKFFQWTTVWSPKQLELEYSQKLWLTVKAPVSLLFEDESVSNPLWQRIVSSLPPDRWKNFTAGRYQAL